MEQDLEEVLNRPQFPQSLIQPLQAELKGLQIKL